MHNHSFPSPTLFHSTWKEKYVYESFPQEKMTFFILPQDIAIPSHIRKEENLTQSAAWRNAFRTAPAKNMQCGQLAVVIENQMIALQPFQLIDAPLVSLFGMQKNWIQPFLSFLQGFHFQLLPQNTRILLFGDLYVSNEQHLLSFAQINKACAWLGKKLSAQKDIAIHVLKDMQSANSNGQQFKNHGYHSIETDPEMILTMKEHWNDINDYVGEMKGKYRQRYRSTRKKGADLSSRFLSVQELSQLAPQLQPLLQAVIDKSTFCLSPETTMLYVRLKEELQEDFLFRLYERNGEIMGFSTAIVSKTGLIAHRIGIDYRHNHTHKIYQNMLYDYVELAIAKRAPSINYGRTALEIKSAVGAEPKSRSVLLRLPNRFFNQILSWFVPKSTTAKWIQRHPFVYQKTSKKDNKTSQKPVCHAKIFSFA